MTETGILAPGERVELVRGVVREMSPKGRAHVVAVTKVFTVLLEALRGRASLYPEAPLGLEHLDSDPEPDVVLCSNPDVETYGTTKTRPLLVVEVAESSLQYDSTEKASPYADARIPEYWVVNLVECVLEVHRRPEHGSYAVRRRLSLHDRLSPEAWPDVDIEVSSLLPRSSGRSP